MRNLKRVLSLALALMMALSLMAFTGSASAAESTSIEIASTKYNDYDDVTPEYLEAIDVTTALNIAQGDETGALNPAETLTRAEATAIAARMLLGADAAETLANVNTYTGYADVNSGHWAASYVAFCDNQGIVSGVGGGNFDPSGPLTGVAFGKVILTVLGYDADKEGLKGDSWATNVLIALANAGINVTDSEGNPINLSQPITRELAMEMTYQALQTPLVEYPTNINNGAAIATRNGATYVTSALAREQRINNQKLTDGSYTVEFAEKYFPSLWLTGATTTSGEVTDRTDAFGRPAYTWTYKNVDIHTYDNEELLVEKWTTGVTGATLANAINYSAISKYNLEVYLDGAALNPAAFRTALTEGSRTNLPYTGNGVQVEVYVDHEPIYEVSGVIGGTGNISIVIINTYLAEVTGTSTVNVFYGYDPTVTDNSDRNVYQSKSASVSDYTRGDKVKALVADPTHAAYSGDDAIQASRYQVQEITDAEAVTDVNITSYSLNSATTVSDTEASYLKTVVAGGETYTASHKACYDANVLYNYNQDREELKSATFAIYLDDYGFALGVEEMEAANNYIFVVGWAHGEDVLGYKGDRALIITVDGTMKAVSADAENLKKWNPAGGTNGSGAWVADTHLTAANYSNAAENTWYTYSMDGDTYVLEREVRNQGAMAVADRNTDTTSKKPDISNSYTSLTKNNNYDSVGGNYAYGNDSSKYIVVTASADVNDGGSITKVDRVVTGIANTNINVPALTHDDLSGFPVSIQPWTWTNQGSPVDTTATAFKNEKVLDTYFLYDNNNYVTYAIVIGDMVATSNDMIYFTGGVTTRSIDGQIYVRYDVIRNGELTTVDILETEANKIHDGRGPLANELYVVGFDANGRVISLELNSGESISTNATPTKNEDNRYVLVTDSGKNLTVWEEGNTLWVKGNSIVNGYVRLASNCAVFLDNKATTLEQALKDTNNGQLKAGQVVAICNANGNATTLILSTTQPDTTVSPLNCTVSASSNVQFNTTNGTSGWQSTALGTVRTGTKVYVRAVENYVIDVAATKTNGITLTDEGNGVYSFTVTTNVSANKIVAVADDSVTMTVTINVVVYDGGGNINLPGYDTYTFVKADFINEERSILAPDMGSSYVPNVYNQTITWIPGGTRSLTFTYSAATGETAPEVNAGHTDSSFLTAYRAAGLNVTPTDVNGVTVIRVTGKETDLKTWLSNPSNSIMNHQVGDTWYAFVGVYFSSPTDAEGNYATGVSVLKNGSPVNGIGMDGEHNVYQWISVAEQQEDDSWSSDGVNRTITYEITWIMADGSTIVDHCQVVINIT